MHSPSQPPFPSIHAHTHKNLFSGVYHLSFSFTPSFWKRNPGQFHCTINTALKQLIDLSFTHTLELHPCASLLMNMKHLQKNHMNLKYSHAHFIPHVTWMSLCFVKERCSTITVLSHQIYSKNHIFIRNVKM